MMPAALSPWGRAKTSGGGIRARRGECTLLAMLTASPVAEIRHALTPRALIIGAVCVAGLGFLIPYSDLKLQGTWIAACHLPIGVFCFFFILVGLVNSFLRKAMPRKALAAPELLFIYCMMLAGSGVPSFGLTEYLFPTLVGYRYFASPENKWEDLFFKHIPDWLTPTNEKAVRDFYEGLPPGQPIPWGAWATPLLAWTILALAFFVIMACVTVIFRKQWVENEHLIFPLVQLPLDMMDGADKSIMPPFLCNKLMWIGAAIPLLIHSWNGFHALYPAVPAIPLAQGLNQFFRGKPWDHIGMVTILLHFSIVGFSFLLSAELSFSLWFFFVLFNLESVALCALGVEVPPIPNYPTQASAALQMLGAFWTLYVYMLYLVRGQIGEMVKKAFNLTARSTSPPGPLSTRGEGVSDGPCSPSPRVEWGSGGEVDEPLSYTVAVWGIIIGFAVIGAWCSLAGTAAWLGMLSFFISFMTAVVLTRMVAEGGLLFIQAPFRPTDMYVVTTGSGWMSPRAQTLHAFFERVFMLDLRTFLMPSIMDSYKIAQVAKLNKRHLMLGIGVAVVIAIAASYISIMNVCYHQGAVSLLGWFCTASPRQPFETLVSNLATPKHASPISMLFIAIGVATTLGLSFARARFAWWPFHPLGYAMGPSWPMIQLWFSILIGWIAKSVLLHYGAFGTYRKAKPFFMGLVVGEFLAAGIWVAISAATGLRGYRFFLF